MANKLDDAFEWYSKAVYEQAAARIRTHPRAFLDVQVRIAAGITKERPNSGGAIILDQKLATLCPDMKTLLEEKIRKLRVEHLILFLRAKNCLLIVEKGHL